jgi:TRAP transporter TAXI family solute receptor
LSIRKLLAGLGIGLLSVTMAACGGGGDEAGASSGGKTQLLIGGSTSGSTGYAYTVAFANLVNSEMKNVNMQVQETAGTIDGVTQILDGNLDMAVSVGDVSAHALAGTGPFEEIGAVEDLRQIMNLYGTPYNLIVSEDSPIDSIEDLEGKSVGAGAPGSGSNEMLRQLLRLHGVEEEAVDIQPLEPEEQGEAFKNGQLDAMAFQGGAGTGWVVELSRARDLRWVNLGDEVLEKINSQEGGAFVDSVIPAGSYEGQDEDVDTFATVVQWVAPESLDEDLVYQMWEVFWANKEELNTAHQVIEQTTPEFASDPAFVPWHPGAKRYIEEELQ